MTFLMLFLSFFYVFLKAFQQRNVVSSNMLAIIPISYCMAFTEILMVSTSTIQVIDHGKAQIIILGIASGTGGTLGCILAVVLHKKLFKRG